jgi:integrase
MGKLNTARLRSLTKPGIFGDGAGLYLQVRGPDLRSWVFRFRLHGRGHLMGLGPLRDVGLAEARELAAAARKLVREGVDPIARRKADRGALPGVTFGKVADTYIAAHEAAWRNAKHAGQWRSTIDTYVVPIFGSKPVAVVEVGDVMRALEPIWLTKSVTANRVRGRIESVLDFAKARGWRDAENPARWRGHLDHLLPSPIKLRRVKHHAALPWPEIGAFTATLDQEQGLAALALKFVILTAARTGEVLKARWSEFDLDAAIWTVPAARMKSGREHRVPLSAPAAALLHELQPLRSATQTDWVFPGLKANKPLTSTTLFMLLRRMGRSDLTVHGFRSTFRDWCAEATNYPREVAEAALAHTLRDATAAAYQRGDLIEKRRRLMEEWGAYCTRPIVAAEVVPIRGAG